MKDDEREVGQLRDWKVIRMRDECGITVRRQTLSWRGSVGRDWGLIVSMSQKKRLGHSHDERMWRS